MAADFGTITTTAPPSLGSPPFRQSHSRQAADTVDADDGCAPRVDPSVVAPEHGATYVKRFVKTLSQQPEYPLSSSTAEPSASTSTKPTPTGPSGPSGLSVPSVPPQPPQPPNLVPSPPFPKSARQTAAAATAHQFRRLPSARLWNPVNFTPRPSAHPHSRRRRSSTPPLPAVPLQHPALDESADAAVPLDTIAGDYPLLTLSEQRRLRHSGSIHADLHPEPAEYHLRRISVPHSFRASLEDGQPTFHHSYSQGPELEAFSAATGKGKQKVAMALANDDAVRSSFTRDLERGPDALNPPRVSTESAADGIGSAISSSNSSIVGEDVQPDAGEEWGPQHPCYPHLNPHVPLDSVEYATTRIIRVKRDWLIAGDLAPTFSNLYPEILDPAGVSEREFRKVIEKLNGELVPIFDPLGFRNMLDAVLGLVTGWLWDDFGLTAAKARLNKVEKWIEQWNQQAEKTLASSEEGVIPPKLISLRQTGYMTLDIQIPDPEIAPAPSSVGAGNSRTALPLQPRPAVVA